MAVFAAYPGMRMCGTGLMKPTNARSGVGTCRRRDNKGTGRNCNSPRDLRPPYYAVSKAREAPQVRSSTTPPIRRFAAPPRHLAQAFDWTQERVPAFVYLVGDVLL
jgi:hypothetical protein